MKRKITLQNNVIDNPINTLVAFTPSLINLNLPVLYDNVMDASNQSWDIFIVAALYCFHVCKNFRIIFHLQVRNHISMCHFHTQIHVPHLSMKGITVSQFPVISFDLFVICISKQTITTYYVIRWLVHFMMIELMSPLTGFLPTNGYNVALWNTTMVCITIGNVSYHLENHKDRIHWSLKVLFIFILFYPRPQIPAHNHENGIPIVHVSTLSLISNVLEDPFAAI